VCVVWDGDAARDGRGGACGCSDSCGVQAPGLNQDRVQGLGHAGHDDAVLGWERVGGQMSERWWAGTRLDSRLTQRCGSLDNHATGISGNTASRRGRWMGVGCAGHRHRVAEGQAGWGRSRRAFGLTSGYSGHQLRRRASASRGREGHGGVCGWAHSRGWWAVVRMGGLCTSGWWASWGRCCIRRSASGARSVSRSSRAWAGVDGDQAARGVHCLSAD
jgi:hypothetical protein